MNTNHEREALKKRLMNKKNRDAFVSACVDQTIPFQIRALRFAEERNWTQKELSSLEYYNYLFKLQFKSK